MNTRSQIAQPPLPTEPFEELMETPQIPQKDLFSGVSLFEAQIEQVLNAQLHCDGINERVKSLAKSLAKSTSPSVPKTATSSSASNGSH